MKIKINISAKKESGIEFASNQWILWDSLTPKQQAESLEKFASASGFMDLQFTQDDLPKLGKMHSALTEETIGIQSYKIKPNYEYIQTQEGKIGGRRIIEFKAVPINPSERHLTVSITAVKPEELVKALGPLLKSE